MKTIPSLIASTLCLLAFAGPSAADATRCETRKPDPGANGWTTVWCRLLHDTERGTR
jgi:hypothetical protein